MTDALPAHVALMSRLGQDRAPETTVNATVLRTSLGLRLVSAGLSVAVLALLWLRPAVYLPAGGLSWVVTAMVLLSVWHVFTAEICFSRGPEFTVRGWLGRTREYRWDDLLSVRHDNRYMYRLTFAKGGKVDIFRNMRGIDLFVTRAAAELRALEPGRRFLG
jgi:hypothetical protein